MKLFIIFLSIKFANYDCIKSQFLDTFMLAMPDRRYSKIEIYCNTNKIKVSTLIAVAFELACKKESLKASQSYEMVHFLLFNFIVSMLEM